MKFTRTVACLAASVVAAGGLALASVDTASAHKSRFQVVGAAKVMAKEKKILGRAMQKVDGRKKGLLGVKIEAFLNGDLDSTPISSDESYDYTGPEGLHRAGAFALRNLVKGSYTVVLSKKGYITQEFTDILVTRTFPRSWMGEIVMQKPSPSKTRLSLSDDEIKQGRSVTVSVKVVPDRGTPLGKVQLYLDGDKSKSDTLVKRDGGRLEWTFSELKVGKHVFKAKYAGIETILGSTSDEESVKVVKKRK